MTDDQGLADGKARRTTLARIIRLLPVSEERSAFVVVAPDIFVALDTDGIPAVVIVNQEFVRRYMPTRHPLRQRASGGDSRDRQDVEAALRQPRRDCR